jgi:hypothetical protein
MKHLLQVQNAFMLNSLLQQAYVHKTLFAPWYFVQLCCGPVMTTEGTWTLICQIGLLKSNMGGRYCVNPAVLVCVCVCVCAREIGYALITDRTILERCLHQDTTQDQNVTSYVKIKIQAFMV